MSGKFRTYYDVLEVSEAASQEEVSRAYKTLVRQFHPDQIPEHLTRLREEATERLKELNAAYEVLSDPQARAAYDRKLGALRAPTLGSGSSGTPRSRQSHRSSAAPGGNKPRAASPPPPPSPPSAAPAQGSAPRHQAAGVAVVLLLTVVLLITAAFLGGFDWLRGNSERVSSGSQLPNGWTLADRPVGGDLPAGRAISVKALIDQTGAAVPYVTQYEPIEFQKYVADHFKAKRDLLLHDMPPGFGERATIRISRGEVAAIRRFFSVLSQPLVSIADKDFGLVKPFTVSSERPQGDRHLVRQGTRIAALHGNGGECQVFFLSPGGWQDLCWPREDVPLSALKTAGPVKTSILLRTDDGRNGWTPFFVETPQFSEWGTDDWVHCETFSNGDRITRTCKG